MNSLRGKTRQLLQAMDFVNIDRLDELDRLLEHCEAFGRCRHIDFIGKDFESARDFGDAQVIDFLAFARRTALRSSGRGS